MRVDAPLQREQGRGALQLEAGVARGGGVVVCRALGGGGADVDLLAGGGDVEPVGVRRERGVGEEGGEGEGERGGPGQCVFLQHGHGHPCESESAGVENRRLLEGPGWDGHVYVRDPRDHGGG